MTQLDDTHKGTIAEYCAQHVLSHFCQVVQVPRQEDFGVDFMCSLLHPDQASLFAQGAFGVQVKCGKEGRKIEYGGRTKGRSPQWRQRQIEALYLNPLYPLLIGVVDIDKPELSLYTTFPIWRVRWTAGMAWKILLKPNSPFAIPNDVRKWSSIEKKKLGHESTSKQSDGRIWTIPLGPPIATISSPVITKKMAIPDTCIPSVVNWWIELDQRNVTYQRMGVPFVYEVARWTTNVVPQDTNITCGWAANPSPGQNVKETLDAMVPMIAALKANLDLQCAKTDSDSLDAVLHLARKHHVPVPQLGQTTPNMD